MDEILAFLGCATPQKWVEQALQHPEELLIDHANCEKKAASTALNLIYRYIDNMELLNKMSRLAREELRHFEQVIALMKKRGIEYRVLSASRYAAGLRDKVRTHEPGKLIDTLIVGAFIEARSCERFAKLAPHLDQELGSFYQSLLKSESRHYKDYLTLAEKVARQHSSKEAAVQQIAERTTVFRAVEQRLVESADNEFRFHSGPVAA